jgi:phage portal protein BeeE
MGKKARAARAQGVPATSTAPTATIGPTIVPYLDARSAVALSAVWRCVTLIADVLSDWPWQEWRGDELLETSRLVRRPMVTMSRREWTWRVVATEALNSTAHLLHVGGTDSAGKPWSLLPVPPAAIMPSGYGDPWGLTPPTSYNVGGQEVSAEYVTCVRRTPFPDIPDWLNGIVNIARTQFSGYLAADVAAARYWRNGGPTTTVLTTDQELDDPDAEKLGRRWDQRRAMGGVAVLSKGATASPWGADPTAESATVARDQINADVGRYFGVPTRILNAPAGDSETYANVENDALDLYRLCLRGYAGPIEDAISELLPGDPLGGRRMALDPSRFLQGDLASRATAWPQLVTAGIVSIDEARIKGFGLPPLGAASAPTTTPDGSTSVAVTTAGGPE